MIHHAPYHAVVRSVGQVEELNETACRNDETRAKRRTSLAPPRRANPELRCGVCPVSGRLPVDKDFEAANHGGAEADILYDARVAVVARIALDEIRPDRSFGLIAAQAGLIHGCRQSDNGDYRRRRGDNTVSHALDAIFHHTSLRAVQLPKVALRATWNECPFDI